MPAPLTVVWFKTNKASELTCSSWRFSTSRVADERRHLVLHAGLNVALTEKGLAITGTGAGSNLVLKAATTAELAAWQSAVGMLLAGLSRTARTAFAFVRERGSLFSPSVFVEHPFIGSRNHRERGITKTYYTVAPAKRSKSRGPIASLLSGGGSAASAAESEPCMLSLSTLPPSSSGSWDEARSGAFLEIVTAMAEAHHPCLLSPSHLEILPAGGGGASREDTHPAEAFCASVRPLLPSGSVADLVARAHDPRQRYSLKHARDGSAAGVSDAAVSGGADEGDGGASRPLDLAPPPAAHSGGPLPLTPSRIALFGRMVLEGLRFLRACGVPATHVHGGNVLLRRIAVPSGSHADSGWACQLSEVEGSLLGLAPYAQQRGLAQPRLAAGSTVAFTVHRDVVAFGHVLHLMATGSELTEAQLSRTVGARVPGPGFPGPAAAWAILERIFIPRRDVAKGPTLVDLLAEPFFSVALPPSALSAAAGATPPTFTGRAASLLKSARKRCGGDSLTVYPAGAGSGAGSGADGGRPLLNSGGGSCRASGSGGSCRASFSGVSCESTPIHSFSHLPVPGVEPPAEPATEPPSTSTWTAEDDTEEARTPPSRKGSKQAARSSGGGGVVSGGGGSSSRRRSGRTQSYSFAEGEAPGLTFGTDAGGRPIVASVEGRSAAARLGVTPGGVVVGCNGHALKGLSGADVRRLVEAAPRPLVLRIQPPEGGGVSGGGVTSAREPATPSEPPATPSEPPATPSELPVPLEPPAASEPLPIGDEQDGAPAGGEPPSGTTPPDAPAEPVLPARYRTMLRAGVPLRGVREKMGRDGLGAREIEGMLAAHKQASRAQMAGGGARRYVATGSGGGDGDGAVDAAGGEAGDSARGTRGARSNSEGTPPPPSGNTRARAVSLDSLLGGATSDNEDVWDD